MKTQIDSFAKIMFIIQNYYKHDFFFFVIAKDYARVLFYNNLDNFYGPNKQYGSWIVCKYT